MLTRWALKSFRAVRVKLVEHVTALICRCLTVFSCALLFLRTSTNARSSWPDAPVAPILALA